MTYLPAPRRTRLLTLAIAAPLLLAALPAAAGDPGAPVPVTGGFQVNTYTTSKQKYPWVDVRPDGGFVVVWHSGESPGSDSSNNSIHAQLFDSAGNKSGGQFQINTYTVNSQERANVAIGPGGDFLVIWSSNGSPGSDNSSRSIQGRLYDSGGSALTGQFQVNTEGGGQQLYPTVADIGDSGFVVTWQSDDTNGNDNSYRSVQARLIDTSGSPLGSDIQVNTHTNDKQSVPQVDGRSTGDFVIAWQGKSSAGNDSSGKSVHLQLFDSIGTKVGGELQVNQSTTGDQRLPGVGMAESGDIVVVWDSEVSTGNDGNAESIQARLYDSMGVPKGPEFQVNTEINGQQDTAHVAVDADGDFVVVWQSDDTAGDDTSPRSVQMRQFTSDGTPTTTDMQVNTHTPTNQRFARVAAFKGAIAGRGTFSPGDGDFVVVWQAGASPENDYSSTSVHGRLYDSQIEATGEPPPEIFDDDFEDGTLDAWAPGVE